MFKLFSDNRDNECPIDNGMRLWMEQAFLWLANQFGENNIANMPILLPTQEHFPIRYDGSKESLIKTAEIVAKQMEIDFNEINIDIFNESIQEIQGDFGFRMWTKVDKDNGGKLAAGLYFDKSENGKYDIFIENQNLKDPENLVAIIAHEFAHIKILGEKRLDKNDEPLTDLTTVIFGLGIFNSNAAFKEHKGLHSWGHNSLGYLKQREWGYALALYAYYRQEETPDWIKYLTPNIKSDFKKSEAFIQANIDKVFIEEKGGS